MPDTLFEVTCKQCGHILATVERLRDAEIAVITDHVRVCHPFDSRGGTPTLGEVMARITCRTVERI
jgi:ribosomal protein L34E